MLHLCLKFNEYKASFHQPIHILYQYAYNIPGVLKSFIRKKTSHINMHIISNIYPCIICEFELSIFAPFTYYMWIWTVQVCSICWHNITKSQRRRKWNVYVLLRFTFQVITTLKNYKCFLVNITHVHFFYYQCKIWYTTIGSHIQSILYFIFLIYI